MNAAQTLHQLLLQPTDVLFFRDGRPMTGALAGHGAAWPLPDVTNHALHAALHRAQLGDVHRHAPGRSSQARDHSDENRREAGRVFGSLLTAGPFPVNRAGTWFFARPKDTLLSATVATALSPAPVQSSSATGSTHQSCNLPAPLRYAVGNSQPPNKEAAGESWISTTAFEAYLRGQLAPSQVDFMLDKDLADTEQHIGIGIDPETQTQDKTNIYSAHYLRLREGYRLGLLAEAMDKIQRDATRKRDLIAALFNGSPQSIVVGGQQRLCTASRSDAPTPLPLPRGMIKDFNTRDLPGGNRWLVKWVLLSPAVWPAIPRQKQDGSPQNAHPGGWLPNWVSLDWDAENAEARQNENNGKVLLTAGQGVRKAQRKGGACGSDISARLVAAIVPKPIVVTGWALPNGTDRPEGGAKSTHLAVPAGAVYYFEADSPEAGTALANALNWHGTDATFATIKNRRSTLMGEKGFGLGVCGTWEFHPAGGVA
jgi:hypothetical protein